MDNRIQVYIQQENIQLSGNDGIYVRVLPITPDNSLTDLVFSYNIIEPEDSTVHYSGSATYTTLGKNEIFITGLSTGDAVVQFQIEKGNYPVFRYTTNFSPIPGTYNPSLCSSGSINDRIILDTTGDYYYDRSTSGSQYQFSASYVNPTGSLPQCGGSDQDIYFSAIGATISGGDIAATTASIGSNILVDIDTSYGTTAYTQPNDSLIAAIIYAVPSGNGACCFGKTEMVLTCPEENIDDYSLFVTPTPTNTSTSTPTPTPTNTPTVTSTNTPTQTQIQENCEEIEYESLEHACSTFNDVDYPFYDNIPIYTEGYLNVGDILYMDYEKKNKLQDGFYIFGCCGTEVSLRVVNGIVEERRLCALPLSPTPTSTTTLTPTPTPKYNSKEIIITSNIRSNWSLFIDNGVSVHTYSGYANQERRGIYASVGSIISMSLVEPDFGSYFGQNNYVTTTNGGNAYIFADNYNIAVVPSHDYIKFNSYNSVENEISSSLYKSHDLRYYYNGSSQDPTYLSQTTGSVLYTEVDIYPNLVLNARVYKYDGSSYIAPPLGYYYLEAYDNSYIKMFVSGSIITELTTSPLTSINP